MVIPLGVGEHGPQLAFEPFWTVTRNRVAPFLVPPRRFGPAGAAGIPSIKTRMTVVPTDWTVMPRNGVKTMIKFFREFLNDETGAAAAEYALILAIVGAGIAVAAATLGTTISTAMNNAGTCITTNGASCP